jgi:hypothetical protein
MSAVSNSRRGARIRKNIVPALVKTALPVYGHATF